MTTHRPHQQSMNDLMNQFGTLHIGRTPFHIGRTPSPSPPKTKLRQTKKVQNIKSSLRTKQPNVSPRPRSLLPRGSIRGGAPTRPAYVGGKQFKPKVKKTKVKKPKITPMLVNEIRPTGPVRRTMRRVRPQNRAKKSRHNLIEMFRGMGI